MPELLILIPLLLLGLIGSITERHKWNNGICKETGEPWVYFDTDSQGGRGYKSRDYVCWVSYPVDKRGD